MSEISKTVGQYLLNHLGFTAILILFILSCLFKLTRREIDPLGAVIRWFGKKFTKDVRDDVAELKKNTDVKFKEIKTDRANKIDELKKDYNDKITAVNDKLGDLREDLDGFEFRTNQSMGEMKEATAKNCEQLKKRIDEMQNASLKSNDMQTVGRIRAHVLDFANSCMNKRKHTKLEFENIIEENTQYKALVEKYGIENDVYKEDYDFIMEIYHKCQKEGSFLNEQSHE